MNSEVGLWIFLFFVGILIVALILGAAQFDAPRQYRFLVDQKADAWDTVYASCNWSCIWNWCYKPFRVTCMDEEGYIIYDGPVYEVAVDEPEE